MAIVIVTCCVRSNHPGLPHQTESSGLRLSGGDSAKYFCSQCCYKVWIRHPSQENIKVYSERILAHFPSLSLPTRITEHACPMTFDPWQLSESHQPTGCLAKATSQQMSAVEGIKTEPFLYLCVCLLISTLTAERIDVQSYIHLILISQSFCCEIDLGAAATLKCFLHDRD